MTGRENLSAAVVFSVVAVACLFLASEVVRRRRFTRAALPLTVLIMAISVWCAAYAASFAHVSIDTAGFWLDQTYWGILVAPTATLFFIARFTRRDRWLRGATRWLLLVMPPMLATAIYAAPLRPYFVGEGRNPANGVLEHPGLTYWMYLAYGSALMVMSTVLVVQFARAERTRHRRSSRVLLMAMALPWMASLASSANLFIADIDPTVVALVVSAGLFAFLVLGERILDVGQLAREEILGTLRDGFIAFDSARRVVDVNERALTILSRPSNQVLHHDIDEVLDGRHALRDAALTNGGGLVRLDEGTPRERLVMVESLPLRDREGTAAGMAILLRDQTRLYSDELTKIGNRRYFFDQVPHLVAVCQRSRLPVSLAILDLDGLKAINDQHGHLEGDLALATAARALAENVRAVDILARIGGDEFAVLMPGADAREAVRVAERVRVALEQRMDGCAITVSVGVAQIGDDDSLLRAISAADHALYTAKARGRNRVVTETDCESES